MTIPVAAKFVGESLRGKKVHFIGIGGSGMSGLARIALADGITVSGSDAKDSTVLLALEALGATVFRSHSAVSMAADSATSVRSQQRLK
jgi:UDP-N-acetylmuramate-alanine ligase